MSSLITSCCFQEEKAKLLFRNGCNSSHFYQQIMRAPISTHFCELLVITNFCKFGVYKVVTCWPKLIFFPSEFEYLLRFQVSPSINCLIVSFLYFFLCFLLFVDFQEYCLCSRAVYSKIVATSHWSLTIQTWAIGYMKYG